MAITPQGASFGGVPGFVPVPPPSIPTITVPNIPPIPIPAAPVFDPTKFSAPPPNTPAEAVLNSQLAAIPGIYAPQFQSARANIQANLAGFGGFTWVPDDPSTPQDESLVPKFDPNAAPGAKQRNAILATRAHAAGMGNLYSSFTDRSIGTALGNLSEQARAMLQQYGSSIEQIATNQRTEYNSAATSLAGLYGADAAFLADHPAIVTAPPVTPTPPPVDVAPVAPPPLPPFDPGFPANTIGATVQNGAIVPISQPVINHPGTFSQF